MSLVIPAFNEAARLPPYLQAIRRHFAQQFPDRYEVVVVDDGGADGLDRLLASLGREWPSLRYLRHARNRGKGAAVRTGVLAAVGDYVLLADADGATPIDQERKLRTAIDAGADVAVASRLLPCPEVVRRRNWFRGVAGRGFAEVARRLFHLPVRDTQCGFKMMRGDVARRLFPLMQQDGFLFDLELLMLASRRNCRIAEVPVDWADQSESRLKMFRHGPRIVRDLWRLRLRQGKLNREFPAIQSRDVSAAGRVQDHHEN